MLCVYNILRILGAVEAGGEVIHNGCLRVPEAQPCVGCSRNSYSRLLEIIDLPFSYLLSIKISKKFSDLFHEYIIFYEYNNSSFFGVI